MTGNMSVNAAGMPWRDELWADAMRFSLGGRFVQQAQGHGIHCARLFGQ